jgi:hypothetical protein
MVTRITEDDLQLEENKIEAFREMLKDTEKSETTTEYEKLENSLHRIAELRKSINADSPDWKGIIEIYRWIVIDISEVQRDRLRTQIND